MSTALIVPVAAAYRHVDKVAVPLDVVGGLKWYELREQNQRIDSSVVAAARARVDVLVEPSDIGFVIVHQCGTDVVLLLVCRWRNDNEIWEAVFARMGGADFVPVGDSDPTRATYCVWELGIVNAERQHWAEFLRSSRDSDAVDTYLAGRFSGVA